ncbi:sigma-54-dependent transcriptional regulator [Candidatus Clavichlamydia salmonicola]|uniref:sigma-54-dependent transcriptional regulator n=1 Tax=Candidatus Clavichlamydia salmonicola TaxID=469812 RepID=UPI001890F169|nr:sigma-54 dependent transcriptional regulator [Candidatus Clavichlamydia salmonicola]
MAIDSVLIIDDEPLMLAFLVEALQRKHYNVFSAKNGREALHFLKSQAFDLVITDMNLPDTTGLDILIKAKKISPSTLFIVITAFGTVENAVAAMKAGASNYLLKPFSVETLEMMLLKTQEHLSLIEENTFLRNQTDHSSIPEALIAFNPLMKQTLAQAQKIASSHASVFLHGESGTGKEVMAGFIHRSSPRAKHPYIKVNCAAIPETLLESEFFGHEKGAFTGADSKKLGRFELAHKGSLLLDEVTEIPIKLQPKLLRAIQELEFERLGGTKSISVNIRILATSNRNLKQAVEENILRSDLYYRLNVVPLRVPALRERVEDIIPLATSFLKKFCKKNGKKQKTFSPSATNKLLKYPWPGNIRELANVLERCIILTDDEVIEQDALFID